jgi:poly(A) polymerase Pap1
LKSQEIRDLIKDDYDDEESLSKKREKVDYLKELVREWSREVAIDAKIPDESIKLFEAKLLPFGSYYLGASSKNGDIDMVVVAS